jgi:hypothetical protein
MRSCAPSRGVMLLMGHAQPAERCWLALVAVMAYVLLR